MGKANETTTKFKVDISDLKNSMQEARKQVAYANSEFKAASSVLDDWSKSSVGLSAKLNQLNSNLDSQKKVLNEYEKTLEEVKKQYGENSKEALEYGTKLNEQQAKVNYIIKDIKKYEQALEDLNRSELEVADTLKETTKETKDAGDGFTILKGAVADFVGDALSALVDTLKEGIAKLVSFGDEADKALNSFQASTGATSEEMAEFENVMNNIYRANYGESFEDIADSMAEIKRQSADIGAEELERMTTNALVLRDTFDFDVSESMRAVNSLMDQFGITSEQAFNLMAQGAQNGLNQNGDLLDVINEYAVHFESAGYSAEEMFNMLSNGVEAGTWSVDKLGDAVKEFNIRMSDGSAKEAVEALGFSWDAVREGWSKGGDEAKDVFNTLINELDGLERTTDGYSIGVGLLGTMYEDLGQDAVLALSQINGEFDSAKSTMEEINAVKYDSVGEALQGIGRSLEMDILMPVSEKVLPTVSDLANEFSEWLNDSDVQQGISDLTDAISQFVEDGLEVVKDGLQWFLDNKDGVIAGLAGIAAGFVAFNVANTIMGVVSAIKAFKAANEGATIAQWLLNAAMNANPIVLLVTIIAAVVAAIVAFIATNEDAREKIGEVWENITQGISDFVDNVKVFFTETVPEFIQGLIDWVQENWESILTFFINPFAGLFQYFYDNNEKFREFVDNAIEQIKELPGKVWEWLVNTMTKIAEWVEDMKAKAKEAGEEFVKKVIEFISQLPGKIWEWLTKAVQKVKDWASDLGTKAKEAGSEITKKVTDELKGLPDKMKEAGKELVNGLWNGISDKVSWLKEKISGFVGDVTGWIKKFFGINSPSKVMADEVGKWLPEGLAEGITNNAKSAVNAMKSVARETVEGATGTVGEAGGYRQAGSGITNNFTQNIYSPKTLSRLDIYRQSKNLLGMNGGI